MRDLAQREIRLGRMKRSQQYVSATGKIALPLILLAAICFRDQAFNAVDYERPTWLVCQVLSFPVGWVSTWIAGMLSGPLTIRQVPGGEWIVFAAACAGTVLNIYLVVFGVRLLAGKFRKRDEVVEHSMGLMG